MAEVPSTHYVKSGDVYIAYQVFGEGSLDLIFVPGFVSNIEAMWQSPNLRCAEHLERSRVRACGAVWHFRGQPDVLAVCRHLSGTNLGSRSVRRLQAEAAA
jgi:hypothetical protein